jgi:large subunit ribosomal protein L21
VEIGNPLVKGAKVIGKVLNQGKGNKIIVFKYKPKKRYKIKRGHRQPYTEVEIMDIKN